MCTDHFRPAAGSGISSEIARPLFYNVLLFKISVSVMYNIFDAGDSEDTDIL